MKKHKVTGILILEAVACIAFCYMHINFSGTFSTIAAFPFEQIGWGLRRLSLLGSGGNTLAIIIYILIGLAPCGIWLFLKKRKKAYRADIILFGISFLLLIVIYYMINPGLFHANVPGTGKWILGGTLYSVFFAYLVIRVLSVFTAANVYKLLYGLKVLLFFLNSIFIYIVCGQSFGAFLEAIQQVQSSNSSFGAEGSLFSGTQDFTMTYLFLGLHYFVMILPYLLDIVVTILSIRMLDALMIDQYAAETVKAVERLSVFCAKALTVTLVSNVVFHILQLVFHTQLYQVDILITIPVFAVVFVLAVLLFTRYVQENQNLKKDNELFI